MLFLLLQQSSNVIPLNEIFFISSEPHLVVAEVQRPLWATGTARRGLKAKTVQTYYFLLESKTCILEWFQRGALHQPSSKTPLKIYRIYPYYIYVAKLWQISLSFIKS